MAVFPAVMAYGLAADPARDVVFWGLSRLLPLCPIRVRTPSVSQAVIPGGPRSHALPGWRLCPWYRRRAAPTRGGLVQPIVGGRGILQRLNQCNILPASSAAVSIFGWACNGPLIAFDLPLLAFLGSSAWHPVARMRSADAHRRCCVMLLLSLYLCHLSTSRANPAHVSGYHKHGRLKRDPCRLCAHTGHWLR